MTRKTYPTAEVWTEKELTQDEYDALMYRFAQMNEKSLQTVVPERNFPVK